MTLNEQQTEMLDEMLDIATVGDEIQAAASADELADAIAFFTDVLAVWQARDRGAIDSTDPATRRLLLWWRGQLAGTIDDGIEHEECRDYVADDRRALAIVDELLDIAALA